MEKTSPTLSEIFEPIRDDLARVDAEFVRHIQSKVELIPRSGKYIQSSGGKRIRPAVLLMAVTVLAARELGRRPYLLTGWLWYLGTLVPVIGLVMTEI